MVIFYSFNLKIAPEYRQWTKLRGKLYALGHIPAILENPFDVLNSEPWGIFKIAGHIAGYHAPIPPRKARTIRPFDERLLKNKAAVWMYSAPFRTYKQAARRFGVTVNEVKNAAAWYRGQFMSKVDPVQDVIDALMADYQIKPRAYTLAELSARCGLTAQTISKRIRRSYPRAQWPACLQRIRRRE